MSKKLKPCVPDTLPLEQLNWEEIVPLMGKASRALARYDGTLEGIINSAVLLSPITSQEAVLSSRIEGTQASLVDVLQHEAGEDFEEDKERDIQEIINYRRALLLAEEHLQNRNITLSLIRELHEVLMNSVRGKDKTPGKFRTDQNWIGKVGSGIEDARFIPPEPMVMEGALSNLETFIGEDYPDPLVQLAIIHAQFEIIHPFNDGNGRLGRMLVPLFLYQKKVLQRPVFYLSEYLEKNDKEYRDRLLAVTNEDQWQEWIIFFLEAVKSQAEGNSEKAKKIHELYERMKLRFGEVTNSRFALNALDALFSKPIINSSDFYERSEISTKITAYSILKQLTEAGIIQILKQGRGQSPSVYVFPELINISEGRTIFKIPKTDN